MQNPKLITKVSVFAMIVLVIIASNRSALIIPNHAEAN